MALPLVRAADPCWTATLARVTLPLALLPAVAWTAGQVFEGDLAPRPEAMAASFLSTLGLCIASVLLLAAGFYLLAPFFGATRHWRRSVALAAFAASPVLLSGVLLVMPVMIVVSVAACVHCFALCYLGAQSVLGCREEDAAMLVAAVAMFVLVSSLAAPFLCSAVGISRFAAL